MSNSDPARGASQKPRWRFTLRELFFLVLACAAISLLATRLFKDRPQFARTNFVVERDFGREWLQSMKGVGVPGRISMGENSVGGSTPNSARREGKYQFETIGKPYDSSILQNYHDTILSELADNECIVLTDRLRLADGEAQGFTIEYAAKSTRGFMLIRVISQQDSMFTVAYSYHEFPDIHPSRIERDSGYHDSVD